MKLEKQVTSLELSKRLKELGVKQESLFYWTRYPFSHGDYTCWFYEKLSTYTGDTKDWEQISAFTVAELGEMFPRYITYGMDSLGYYARHSRPVWKEEDSGKDVEHADTEADARAGILIYLIEHNLLSKKKRK